MKIIVFLPIIIFFSIFGLLIFGFIFFIIKMLRKTKAASWTGVVIDKNHNTKRDFDTNKIEHFYVLVVKPDDGKRDMKLGVSQQLFDSFEIGDKIKKDSGEMFPKKA